MNLNQHSGPGPPACSSSTTSNTSCSSSSSINNNTNIHKSCDQVDAAPNLWRDSSTSGMCSVAHRVGEPSTVDTGVLNNSVIANTNRSTKGSNYEHPPAAVMRTISSDRLVTGPSCRALRTAVSALYSVDDFVKEKIGSGFFSEVYRVSSSRIS